MTWEELNWSALERLRARFLQGPGSGGVYWETPEDVANYDFTFGERIGWKWDHVLRELTMRGWKPHSRTVFDWGCGSGIAARRTIAHFGAENFDSLTVWDHSALACDFAETAARDAFPSLRVSQATPGFLSSNERDIGLLIVSHVLNELAPDALTSLQNVIERSEAVIWVEPGTRDVSRQLGQIRDELRTQFHIVAPCTHELGCPMFAEGNERHWCHFFAPPPSEIFADSNWVKFGQRAGIDLRSLPYCFIALDGERTAESVVNSDEVNSELDSASPVTTASDQATSTALSRVIGRVEHFKPYARWLNCDANGLMELELPKRADPALFKQLERTKAPLVYRWQREGEKVSGGEAAGLPPT
jgi:hypothetical protein